MQSEYAEERLIKFTELQAIIQEKQTFVAKCIVIT